MLLLLLAGDKGPLGSSQKVAVAQCRVYPASQLRLWMRSLRPLLIKKAQFYDSTYIKETKYGP